MCFTTHACKFVVLAQATDLGIWRDWIASAALATKQKRQKRQLPLCDSLGSPLLACTQILSWSGSAGNGVTGGLELNQDSFNILDSVGHNIELCCETCVNKTCMRIIVERCCRCWYFLLLVLVECSWKPRSLRLSTQFHHSVCP